MANKCEHPGCDEFEYLTELSNPWCDDDPHNGMTFCTEHVPWGFCKVCGCFSAGCDDYDHSPIEGMCGPCVETLRDELGENIEYDEFDYFPDPYDE